MSRELDKSVLRKHRKAFLSGESTGQRLWDSIDPCTLCPRQCGIHRRNNQMGFCGIYWQEATDERRMIDLRKILRWERKFFHPETLRDALAIRNVMLRHHQYLSLMRVEPSKDPKPAIWEEFRSIITESGEEFSEFELIERAAFYERAEKAYAVVATSEKTLYANIILKKGGI